MSQWTEQALQFDCGGATIVGVLATPAAPARVGVVIVVGGPQYRAGSHRQFVLLARALAASGIAALRFDFRGMGDSDGPRTSFLDAHDDIRAAIDTLHARVPGLRHTVLWGLCDGATACAVHAALDARVNGLVLVNPWVHDEPTAAKARLQHYYGRRLVNPNFWRKLVGGKVDIGTSLRGLWSTWRTSASSEPREPTASTLAQPSTLAQRIAAGLSRSVVPRLVVLSGRDVVAAEFALAASQEPTLAGAMADPATERLDMTEANHTFSSQRWRDALAHATIDWLRRRVAVESAPVAAAVGTTMREEGC